MTSYQAKARRQRATTTKQARRPARRYVRKGPDATHLQTNPGKAVDCDIPPFLMTPGHRRYFWIGQVTCKKCRQALARSLGKVPEGGTKETRKAAAKQKARRNFHLLRATYWLSEYQRAGGALYARETPTKIVVELPGARRADPRLALSFRDCVNPLKLFPTLSPTPCSHCGQEVAAAAGYYKNGAGLLCIDCGLGQMEPTKE